MPKLFDERSGVKKRNISEIIEQIEAGFPIAVLDAFQKSTGLPLDVIAPLIRLPARTLSRRRAAGKLRPEESERLFRLSMIVDKAIALFEGDTTAAIQWLQTPQPALAERQPLDFARTEVGAREVEDLIGRLEHGVFS
jgi:putative toxin-antitoxin system antitoxin component (TIGR02293 family)